MKLSSRVKITLLLLWPLLGLAGLVALKETQFSGAPIVRLPITGFDPRSLMYGHYLMFRFDGPSAPDTVSHEYYVPESEAQKLSQLLSWRSTHKFSLDVQRAGAGEMRFGELYIDGIEWQQYLAQNPK